MLPKNPKSQECQSLFNTFSDARMLMTFALIALLSSGCNLKNNELQDNNEDLSGVMEDLDTVKLPKENSTQSIIEEDSDPIIICEELEIVDAGIKEIEIEETHEEMIARIDKVLKFGVPSQLTEKINRIRPNNICYVGDSYMVGITDDRGKRIKMDNVEAKVGRPFVSDNARWANDDIQKYAIEALNDPKCKLLILNGGINDLYSYCHRIPEAKEALIEAYKRVFELAWEKRKEVIVFDIPKPPIRARDKKEINLATDEINMFLDDIGAFMLINTDEIVEKYRKDKMHPRNRDYLKLFKQIRKYIR